MRESVHGSGAAKNDREIKDRQYRRSYDGVNMKIKLSDDERGITPLRSALARWARGV